MTGSLFACPRRGNPQMKTSTTTYPPAESSHKPTVDLPVLNSIRRTAPASRPYGRCAVGLRPSLDPDACFDAPSQDKEARTTKPQTQKFGLDPAPLLQE